jgi:hypothetical protein
VAAGAPAVVITEESLETHFALRARVKRDDETGAIIVHPMAASSSSVY